jgi:hypothetical protein
VNLVISVESQDKETVDPTQTSATVRADAASGTITNYKLNQKLD